MSRLTQQPARLAGNRETWLQSPALRCGETEMTRQATIVICLSVVATGCATPVTMLKNDATGQVARCGGDTGASMAGGLIGYTIQEGSDQDCVRDFELQGFKPMN